MSKWGWTTVLMILVMVVYTGLAVVNVVFSNLIVAGIMVVGGAYWTFTLVNRIRVNLETHSDAWQIERTGKWLNRNLDDSREHGKEWVSHRIPPEVDWEKFERYADEAVKNGVSDPVKVAFDRMGRDRAAEEIREIRDSQEITSQEITSDEIGANPFMRTRNRWTSNLSRAMNRPLKGRGDMVLYGGDSPHVEYFDTWAAAQTEQSLRMMEQTWRPAEFNRDFEIMKIRQRVWNFAAHRGYFRMNSPTLYSSEWNTMSTHKRRTIVLRWYQEECKILLADDVIQAVIKG
jgi:hypothetical protein